MRHRQFVHKVYVRWSEYSSKGVTMKISLLGLNAV
jgi:hypothetical protein